MTGSGEVAVQLLRSHIDVEGRVDGEAGETDKSMTAPTFYFGGGGKNAV